MRIKEIKLKRIGLSKIGIRRIHSKGGNTPLLLNIKGETLSREISSIPSLVANGTLTNQKWAKVSTVKGNSVVWNQLTKTSTITRFNYTDTIRAYWGIILPKVLPINHKLLVTCKGTLTAVDGIPNIEYLIYVGSAAGAFNQQSTKFNNGTSAHFFVTPNTDTRKAVGVRYFGTPVEGDTLLVENIFVYDLTLMFGAGNEPTTIEEFESRKPIGVTNDYNEGEILSYQQWGEKVVWNQLVKGIYQPYSGVTVKINDDNSLTINGNPSIRWAQVPMQVTHSNSAKHILYLNVQKISGSYTHGTNDLCFCDGYATANAKVSLNGGACIYKSNESMSFGIIGNTDGVGDSYDNYTARFIVIDLTLMFGEGNEPTTIEEFERRRPRNVTDEYNEGTEISGDISLLSVANDTTATTPLPNVSLIKDADGNQLFPYGLCSAGSVYDEITATKAIKRIGVVDMGTLDWSYNSTNKYFYTRNVAYYHPFDMERLINNAMCKTYVTRTTDTTGFNFLVSFMLSNDDSMFIYGNPSKGRYLFVHDDSYTDASTFKQAMQGVLLYYELATPIEVEINKWKAEYKVEQGGTEQIVSANDTTNLKTDIIYGNKG